LEKLAPHFLVLPYAMGFNSIQLSSRLKIRLTGIILNSYCHFHNASLIRDDLTSLHRTWIKGLAGIQPGKKYGSEEKRQLVTELSESYADLI
jgi:hypothetical protein